MTSPITHISVGGEYLDLADVEYQVNITHGRNDISSQPEASTAVIALRGNTGPSIELGAAVDITAWDTARFTGEVSDLSITHLSTIPPTAVTTITCIGNLSNLGGRLTGASGYAKQTVYERVEEILTDSGENYVNGGTSDLELFAADNGATTCLDALQSLAEWSGATYFDTPKGRVAFESYGDRGITAFMGTWAPLNEPWSFYEQTWDSFPTSQAGISLPGGGIIFTPTWTKNQFSIVNDVTVSHGDPASQHTSTDDASIALYGRRALNLTTGLDKAADATTRASEILLAQAYPLWNLGNISIYVDQLTETDRNLVLELISGSAVIVNDLPEPAPFSQFLGIVEGWSESYTPGQHILTLSISDPRYSFQTVTWGGVDPALTWGNVNAEIIWYNVVKSDDLLAA